MRKYKRDIVINFSLRELFSFLPLQLHCQLLFSVLIEKCPAGFTNINMVCVICADGEFEQNSKCVKCPSGEWSSHQSMPFNCVPECGAGERSNGPGCQQCPHGQYQDEVKHAHVSCVYCPTNMTTAKLGATSQTECVSKYIILKQYYF